VSTRRSRCGAAVVLDRLTKRFGERRVLEGIELSIAPGEFVTVVGRSGCGKSTLLRLLGGLDQPTSGTARVLGGGGTDARATLRVVFQEPRLLPWRSVLDNVRIGPVKGDLTRAREALADVGLADRAGEYPGILSGGQRQRVALARALVHEPCLMLLDEPFGALDALTRIEAQRLVERLWLERGFTAVLVTHDVGEAVLLGDRVVVIDQGRVVVTFHVEAERPRRREDPSIASLTGKVLEAIFASGAEESRGGSLAPDAESSGMRRRFPLTMTPATARTR
jgi:sulfonate transport system ATP-binding protein